ncbi:MAG TPA: class I SAM-dependent methyltransferase [Gaiellaceae bacterium]|nr:class I SAM-dependent methyltransferase [Gaiellaceae bacterium]
MAHHPGMVDDAQRHRLRTTFEDVAELYDWARPTYPASLFDDLLTEAGLSAGSRVLEIGCGTGKATVDLAARGLEITCVELGAQLAEIARRNLAPFADAEVVTTDFETWDAGDRCFDAVVAFTAFHWLDPDVAYKKVRQLLGGDGELAIVTTDHVRGDPEDPFWAAVQPDYVELGVSDDERPPPHPEDVADLRAQIDAGGLFLTTTVRRYLWDVSYTADEYIAVLDTYSGHRAVDDETRAALYARIHARILAAPGGAVRKTYLATLNVARCV